MVGSFLTDAFMERGETVYSPSRQEMDITDRKKVVDTIRKINPDILIHCAALTHVDECEIDKKRAYLVNVIGTQHIIEGCASVNCKMVYFSTDFIFDGKKGVPYSETDIPNPLNVYGHTKLLGEYCVSHFLHNFLILRVSKVFGAKGRNFASLLPVLMLKEKKLFLTNNLINSPTYIVDLANALILLVKKDFLGIANICNKGECSWYKYALKVKEILGREDTELIPIEFERFSKGKAERPRYSVLDTTLLESIGCSMPEWETSLKMYLAE